MKKVVLLILLLFLFFMALQNWEGLQKNATNDETIEQAIARLIAVHEGDGNSHLGANESLAAHKAADVIDHPAQSIVADKITGGDVLINTHFETLDPWVTDGTVSNTSFDGLHFYVEYNSVNLSKAYSAMFANAPYFLDTSDMYFECQAVFDLDNSHFQAWLGPVFSELSSQVGFAFQVRDGVMYAHVKRGTTVSDTNLGSGMITGTHFYSAYFSFTDQTVVFKIDGTVVATISVPAGSNWSSEDRTPNFGLSVSQTNLGDMYVQYLYAWRKILTE